MRTISIGTFRSIPVRLHVGALAIAGLVAWIVGGTILPNAVPGAIPTAYLFGGVIAGLLLLASIFGHEASHAVVARRYGVNVSSITLWLLGGVAHLEGDAPSPRAEARIAGAGPLFSLVAAISLGLMGGILWTAEIAPVLAATLLWLAVINTVLALFNLLPGAPLDGGRLLHAWLWKRSGNRERAVERSTQVGRYLGIGIAGLGAIDVFVFGNIGGLWTGLIGWFLFTAATQENRVGRLMASLRGKRLRDVMSPLPASVPDWWSVTQVLAIPRRETRLLLHDFGGDASGILDVTDLPRLLRLQREDAETMRLRDLGLPTPVQVDAEADMTDTLRVHAQKPLIVTEAGRPVGVVTRRELERTLLMHRLGSSEDSDAAPLAA